jgi:beta-xylosidase
MKSKDINIRDPFVLVYDGKYYLYGTRGATAWGLADGFDVYVGTDLENWSEPIEIFHNNGDFWADRNYWAPEVHYYNGDFYLFATFKSETSRRGTQILKASSPLGPFQVHSNGPVTPGNWECIDGTFYLNQNGIPYMIFCHEHRQVIDGSICIMELTHDLKKADSEPVEIFKASSAPWVVPLGDNHYITDGPFMYRCNDGDLLMIWSSFGSEGYTEAIARSDNGEITGNWIQEPELLFKKDGGHGMIFKSLEGDLFLTLHSPNETLEERPCFYRLKDENNTLTSLSRLS